MRRLIVILILMVLIIQFMPISKVYGAPEIPLPKISVNIDPSKGPQDFALSLQILFLLTILTLAPFILIMMTSFTRIIIVLSFIRNALGTQQIPPNQVLIGLALFLTLFTMAPVGIKINNDALQPYLKGEITQQVALNKAMKPIREFMLKQTREKDLALFVNIAQAKVNNLSDIPMHIIIPAFIISELKTAFQIGFIIYIPFLIIDMIVASTLMSMGMFMLPPVLISLPFKILLFILVDGWNLVIKTLIIGFR